MNIGMLPVADSAPPASDSSANQAAGDQLDRRRRERNITSSGAILRREDGMDLQVELVDLSEDGAGIWAGEPIQVREHVVLGLMTHRTGRIWIEAAVVDYRTISDDSARLGLQFSQRLRPEVLASALH